MTPSCSSASDHPFQVVSHWQFLQDMLVFPQTSVGVLQVDSLCMEAPAATKANKGFGSRRYVAVHKHG